MSNPKKKGTGVKLWSVMTVVMVILLIASIIGTNISLGAAQAINIFLKTDTYKVVENGDGTEDTEYFKSDYATRQELEAAGQAIAEQVAGEGAVLLLNNGALPLAAGAESNLKEALEEAGFGVRSGFAPYHDAAIVNLSRVGDEEMAMLEAVKKQFDTVIVLVTAAGPADCGFLRDYDVDAALWIGCTDAWGLNAAADILAGSVNPSGRLAETGCFAGENAAFPFGYGLSYTTFDWSSFRCSYNRGSDLFTVNVTVTNTGDVAGREVVQVYLQRAGTEMSAVELCGFSKTELLEPGVSANVTITVRGQKLAAYDERDAGTYILAAGDHYLTAAPDALAARSNVLAARGDDTEGDAAFTHKYTVEEADPEKYAASAVVDPFDTAGMPTMGADNGLDLSMFIGRDFDDPAWEKLLDQLTFEDMILLTGQNTAAVPSVGKPAAIDYDGSRTSLNVLAATFDLKLAEEMGKLLGEECLARGVSGLESQSMASCSEGFFLTEAIAAAETRGLCSKGVYIIAPDLRSDGQTDADREDPAVWHAMRQACHRILYTVANSNAMNGISSSTTIVAVTPWWQIALYALVGVCALGTVACGTRLVFAMGRKKARAE